MLDNFGRKIMLGKLELKLKSKDKLGYQMSSLFHGALMELLPERYADYLHTSQLHPYTQHLEFRGGEWYWIICCLNKETIKIIIQDTLWDIENIEIKNRNLTILITWKSYSEIIFQERRYQEKPIFQGLQKLWNAVRYAGIYIECNTYAAGTQQRY